jgi:hypothetical protein
MVGFYAIQGSRYALEWKRSGPDGVESRYTLFDVESLAEIPVTREEFRNALRVVRLEGLSREAGPTLNLLINQVVRELPEDVYLSLRYSDQERLERYLMLPSETSTGATVEVPIIGVNQLPYLLALLPGGTVFSVEVGDSEPRRTRLPVLPEGFRYTDLAYSDGWLIVSWEQVDFFRVGAAGLMMTPFAL